MPTLSIEVDYPDLWLDGSPPGHLHAFFWEATQEGLEELLADRNASTLGSFSRKPSWRRRS